MRCREARFLISMQMDGELGANQKALLAEHLQSCSACRAYAAAVCRTDALLRESLAGDQAPAGFFEHVMASLPDQPARQHVRRRARFLPGVAAAVMVLLVAGAWLWSSGYHRAPPAVETPIGITAFKVPSSENPGSSAQTPGEPRISAPLEAAQEHAGPNAAPKTAPAQRPARHPPRE